MIEDSEKRFHTIMDKLFHAPKSTPKNFTSSSSSLRGKRKANATSALALVDPKSSRDVVEAPAATQCRPWDHGDLVRRLTTFKSMTWFAKPNVVSALNCARRGWINVDTDIITCEACGARLLFSTPSSWSQEQVEKAALVFSLKLDNGHKLLCPWSDNSCDESLAQFPPSSPPILVDKFRERCNSLLQLSALPVISSSAIKYMKSPELQQFLEKSLMQECGNWVVNISRSDCLGSDCDMESAKLYYQAQVLISLCGWELRSLPYVIDTKNISKQPVGKANLSYLAANERQDSINMKHIRTDELTEASRTSKAPSIIQSDPNSVVLDCQLCGATVGLWMFSTVPQPVELFRLVGYTELTSENNSAILDSGTGNHPEERRGGGSADPDAATFSKERSPNLNLTIAGGPLPTKQNFKATISLPIIGQNLRAWFSDDSGFRDLTSLNQVKNYQLVKENDSCELLEGTEVNSEGTFAGATHDFIKENLAESAGNVGLGTTRLRNGSHIGLEAVGDPDASHFIDYVITTPDDSYTNSENDRNSSLINIPSYNDATIVLHGQDTTLTGQQEALCVTPCSEANSDTEKTRTNPQSTSVTHTTSTEGSGERLQTSVNMELVSSSTGQTSSDKAMEFDPFRQHRHFCPWIASIDNGIPGWKQTLSALQRQEGFSPSPELAPTASIIKVDDPITSVRNLFMSPSPKRMKRTV